MEAMKRQTAIAITFGVWIAALGSAAALAYDATRPVHLAGITLQPEPQTDTESAVAAPASELQAVLYIPEATIVAKAQR
jgi:hypothetical protein